jgi:VanZ family protein
MVARRRTTAWALSWLCVLVIAYASLYPFDDWRNQDIAPWFFVGAPWSAYNTWFDIFSNLLGYLPLGFWWCLAAVRSQWSRIQALSLAVACACLLSFGMECLQTYLPTRVPSQLDWLLNTSGALCGAGLALVLEKRGWLYHWSQFRRQWLTPDASGSLVLLVLWPLALLYPVTVPFGLGHVSERLGKMLQDMLPGFENHLAEFNDALTMTPSLEMLCSMGIRIITQPQERLQQRRQSCPRHHKEMRRNAHKPHLVCLELMCTIQNIREIQLRTSPGMNSASAPKNTSPLLI